MFERYIYGTKNISINLQKTKDKKHLETWLLFYYVVKPMSKSTERYTKTLQLLGYFDINFKT